MCGLVGMAGFITGTEERLFRQLLIMDSLRGEHSTGIAAVTTEGVINTAKRVGDPFQLFETHECDKLFRSVNRVLIGHNRYATTGKVNRRNAHPFELAGLVGAHNGTLTNKHSIPNQHLFDVDSEALYNHIDDVGIDEAIKITRGAWALTWFDKENTTINFLRNKERPLYYTFNKDRKVIMWASEAWMLMAVSSRENYEISKIYALPEDTHFSYPVSLKNAPTTVFDKAKARSVKGAPEYKVSTYTGNLWSTGETEEKKVNTQSQKQSQKFYDEHYLGSTRAFEIGGEDTDETGNKFLFLDDALKPDYDVRIYITKETSLVTGQMIRANVGSCRRDSKGKLFYMIRNDSVKVIPTVNKPKDNRGHEISDADLKSHYHSCSWCSSPIDHSDSGNIYVDISTGVICKHCACEPSVVEYLRTM